MKAEIIEEHSQGLSVYQHEKAQIDIQISTAKSYPRDLKRCIENAVTIVTMDLEIAQSCHYAIVKGGKSITGASIYLAKILVQELGNMRYENRVVGFDSTHVTCEAVCWDLEKNNAMKTTIKKPIVGNSGKFTYDMQSIVSNAANSIALRNAIFAVVGENIVKKVYNAAKEKITGKITNENELITARTKIVNGLKEAYPSFNLKDIEIANAVQKSSLSDISKDDLIILIGITNSIKSGEQQVEDVFRPKLNSVNKVYPEDKSAERILELIKVSKTKESLEKLKKDCVSTSSLSAYDDKMKSFK